MALKKIIFCRGFWGEDRTEMQERGKKGKEEENKGRYPVGPTMI